MKTLNITLPEGSSVCNGKQITFRAPCDCTGVERLAIDGEIYDLLNIINESVSTGNIFVDGALVSVILDTENNRAYIQNVSSTITYHTKLLADNWKFDDVSYEYYYQDVDVDGILESDNPVVDIDPEPDDSIFDISEYDDNMCKIFHITTSANSIKVWAKSLVNRDLPIQLKVVR